MTDVETHVLRPPKQERSRAAWGRALDAGLALLQSGGLDAVTVTEVCRVGEISPPSLYARVDGRAGLIAAIYEHGMASVVELEHQLLDPLEHSAAEGEGGIGKLVTAMTEVFKQQRALLRPIIASSAHDERIHTRGVEEALRVQDTMVRMLKLPDGVGNDIAAMIFAELVVRTVYGNEFTSRMPESDEQFIRRLTRVAVARTRR